jgi:Ca2+-binding EF-hand superfamily protein
MWNVFRSLSPASVRPARVFWLSAWAPQPEKESTMTVSSVGSSSLTQQLLQLQQSMFATADEFQSIGQNVQGGGQRPPPPPMSGSSSASANFSGDTLRSLMSVQMLGSDSGSTLTSADSDADGLLSADEISSALSANAPDGAKGLGLEGKMASDMISALDSDDDGSLSSDEIAAGLTTASTIQSAMQGLEGMGGPPPGGPPPGGGGGGGSTSATGSSGVFETLDTNQDGTVSAAELAAANTDDTDAASAAKDLISASDTDGDGALSGSEFADMLDAAKSSSTTTAPTDSTSGLSSLLSSSTLASDLMAKLLAQLDSALASKSGSTSTVSATA